MRIARIDLTRYGRFTDRSIELPAGELDLHLVIGPNEAGKSTTRAGLSELLFGIEARSRFGFLHDYSVMRIGAVLEHGETSLAFQRRKGNKGTLLDASDKALPDTSLVPFLGSADRAFFERMFSLDHAALVEGGRQLLDAKDDIGRMLFQASGGLSKFGEVLKELDGEVDKLFAMRKGSNRAYWAAHEDFETAQRTLKDAVCRTQDFLKAEEAIAKAGGDLDEAKRHHDELLRTRARLERVKRVAPALGRRRSLLAEVATLASVPLLPSSAAKERQEAATAIARAEHDLERLGRELTDATARRDEAVVDGKLLALAVEIRAAAERRQQLGNHRADLGRRQAEVQTMTREVEDLAGKLGWAPGSLDELRARIPSELTQQSLTTLVARHATLHAESRAAAKALADKVSERDELARGRNESLDGGAPGSLVDALERARKLGDAEARRRALAGPVQVSSKAFATSLAQLAPFTGEVDALRAMVPPPDEEIEALAQRLGRLDQALVQTRAERTSAVEALERHRLQERQVQRDARPVTAGELLAVRKARDERWSDVRSLLTGEPLDAGLVAARADELERSLHDADALADRRFDAAEASVTLQKIRADIELGEKQLEALDARLAGLDTDVVEARRALHAIQSGLGVAHDTPAALRSWLARRTKALDLATQTEQATSELDRHDQEVAAASQELHQALVTTTTMPTGAGSPEGRSFAGLVRLATESIDALETARKDQAALLKQLDVLERAVPDLEARRDAAQRALGAWLSEFAARVAELALPGVTEPEVASKALELVRNLGKHLAEIDQIERARIATMRRDLDAFALQVTRLTDVAAPDLAGRDSFEAAQELARRLGQAEDARRAHEAAAKDIARLVGERIAAETAKAQAETALKPLIESAQVEGASALDVAIEQSDRRRRADEELRRAELNLLEIGDGHSIEQLEQEASSEELALLDDRLATVNEEVGHLEVAQKDLAIAAVNAKLARDRIAGQADAAAADSRRSEAVAKMSEAIERYVRVRTARELLRWAIERYRREKQGPLLARASELFATLTLGELQRLVVEYDDKDQPHLAGVRSDGKRVMVEGMSTGTADQLFLALRVAALETHLEVSPALPFVADDLLAHFDDRRSAAAFRVLGHLARRTQVLFFSHHEHLVEVARSALGEAVQVVRL